MVTGTFQWAKGPIGTFHNCDLCYYIENSEETVAKLGKFGLRQKQNKATVTFDECFNRTRNEKKTRVQHQCRRQGVIKLHHRSQRTAFLVDDFFQGEG